MSASGGRALCLRLLMSSVAGKGGGWGHVRTVKTRHVSGVEPPLTYETMEDR